MQEVEKVVAACTPAQFPFNTPPTQEEFTRRVARYEAVTEILQSLLAIGCYWGSQEQLQLWVRALQRLASPLLPGGGSYYEVWARLAYYPALLSLYCGGVAAVAAKKYETFSGLAWQPMLRNRLRGKPGPLAACVNAASLLSAPDSQSFNPGKTLKFPVSEHLVTAIRPQFSSLLPDDAEYERAFDEFEFMLCLAYMHFANNNGSITSWPPLGRFVYRHVMEPNRLIDELSKEAEEQGKEWLPLKAGLFDGSFEAFKAVRDELLSSELFRQLAF